IGVDHAAVRSGELPEPGTVWADREDLAGEVALPKAPTRRLEHDGVRGWILEAEDVITRSDRRPAALKRRTREPRHLPQPATERIDREDLRDVGRIRTERIGAAAEQRAAPRSEEECDRALETEVRELKQILAVPDKELSGMLSGDVGGVPRRGDRQQG